MGAGMVADNNVVITLPPGHYTLTAASPLPGIDPSKTVQILGNPNAALTTTIDANSKYGLFVLSSTTSNLSLSDVSLVGGNTQFEGGAVNVIHGTLTVTRSRLLNNHADSSGGAIFADNGGSVTVSKSLFAGNDGSSGGAVAISGANGATASHLTMTDSTVTNNNSGATAGPRAISVGFASTAAPTATLTNDTVAISQGPMLEASTGPPGDQPGVNQIRDTLISGALGAGKVGCGTGVTDLGNNLASGASGCAGALTGNAGLGPLALYGGPTETRALTSNSDAVDAGDACAAADDQRGIRRGELPHTGTDCDIGAFEQVQDADLGLDMTGPTDAELGNLVVYRFTISSTGPTGDTARPFLLPVLPAGLQFVSATPSAGFCDFSVDPPQCGLPVPNGSSETVTLRARATALGPQTVSASMGSLRPDSDSKNDTASLTTTIAPAPPGADRVLPLLSVGLAPFRFPAAPDGTSVAARRATGTTVSYTLSEAAGVTFRVQRPRPGRRVGGRCVKPTDLNSKRRKCTRVVTLLGLFQRLGNAGPNSFHFTGRLHGHALKPGLYRLAGGAKDSGGNHSKRAFTPFRIVR
jgi:hypothetical protein